MATVVEPGPRTAGKHEQTDQQQPADVLVVFGITGDLAKVMTFHSLYRLEARGPPELPDRGRGGRRLVGRGSAEAGAGFDRGLR